MKTYTLKAEQFLPVKLDVAWDFFSSAKNLSRITPPEMQFKITSEFENDGIYDNMVIDYIVRPVLGIPLKWKTVITQVNKPFQFADMQAKGPYKKWVHVHTFIEKENGTLVKDEVTYALPFNIFGRFAHFLFVRKKLEQIFEFRKETLERLFPGETAKT